MAITNPQIPSASSDVIAIFNSDGVQLFSGYQPLRITVNEDSRLMAHPREDGSSQIDHKVDIPISISIASIPNPDSYREVYAELVQARVSGTPLIVQTRVATYDNMFIESMPHEEDPKYFDTITLSIGLTQAFIFEPIVTTLTTANTANSNDASTLNRGQQSTTDANTGQDEQGSTLFRIFN